MNHTRSSFNELERGLKTKIIILDLNINTDIKYFFFIFNTLRKNHIFHEWFEVKYHKIKSVWNIIKKNLSYRKIKIQIFFDL